MTETSATKPPQLRAARARKQSIIKFVILFVTLAFLFVPLLAMLIFTPASPAVRPLVGRAVDRDFHRQRRVAGCPT